jgi:hypothetical protein
MPDPPTSILKDAAPQRPTLLIGGFSTALAASGIALGTYPVFAPLCIMIVVVLGWFAPRNNTQFANGALAALVGILLFGATLLAIS